MNHSPGCSYEKARELAAVWEKRWPDHCKDCKARGEHRESYDPSPAGVALSPGCMVDVEPCASCVAAGRCPRCNKVVWPPEEVATGELLCPECGWSGPKDGHPGDGECFCEFSLAAEEERALAEHECVRSAAFDLLEALANAPAPESEDAIAWLHSYSRWYHGERAKAIQKTKMRPAPAS